MKTLPQPWTAMAVAAFAASACAHPPAGQPIASPAAQAKADSGRPAYTAADVRFMSGMIGHHAQAVTMGGWAPSHDASGSGSLAMRADRGRPKR